MNDLAFAHPNKQLCILTCGDDKMIKVLTKTHFHFCVATIYLRFLKKKLFLGVGIKWKKAIQF